MKVKDSVNRIFTKSCLGGDGTVLYLDCGSSCTNLYTVKSL